MSHYSLIVVFPVQEKTYDASYPKSETQVQAHSVQHFPPLHTQYLVENLWRHEKTVQFF